MFNTTRRLNIIRMRMSSPLGVRTLQERSRSIPNTSRKQPCGRYGISKHQVPSPGAIKDWCTLQQQKADTEQAKGWCECLLLEVNFFVERNHTLCIWPDIVFQRKMVQCHLLSAGEPNNQKLYSWIIRNLAVHKHFQLTNEVAQQQKIEAIGQINKYI